MRRLLTLLVILVLGLGQASGVLGQQAASPSASPPAAQLAAIRQKVQLGEVCAWPVTVSINALNVAYPETNAAYYLMLYTLAPGQSLVLEGAYPFARFFSLTTYYGLGGGGQGINVLGWLSDTAIAPDPGSGNPTTDPNAPTDPAHRRWTVRVTGTAPVGGATPSAATAAASPVTGANVIPAHPVGATNTLGALVLRIYVPQDPADPTGGVSLPALSLESADGSRRQLVACTAEEAQTFSAAVGQMVAINVAAAERLPLPPDASTTPVWVHARVPGLGPNPDNRYLMAPVAWTPGRVVVIRGKAPTFPNTRGGESVTKPSDLRYWSFCTGANIVTYPLLYPTTACVGDFQIPVGADGAYTIAVSQTTDRPANATEDNGVAWLQGADPTLPDLIAMRHMLPSTEFYSQSVWAVPEGVPGAAETIMGPYYPQITYCDKATFEAGGANACFAAEGIGTPVATPGD